MSLDSLFSGCMVSSWGLLAPTWLLFVPSWLPFWIRKRTPKRLKKRVGFESFPKSPQTLKGTAENEDLLSWAFLNPRGPLW